MQFNPGLIRPYFYKLTTIFLLLTSSIVLGQTPPPSFTLLAEQFAQASASALTSLDQTELTGCATLPSPDLTARLTGADETRSYHFERRHLSPATGAPSESATHTDAGATDANPQTTAFVPVTVPTELIRISASQPGAAIRQEVAYIRCETRAIAAEARSAHFVGADAGRFSEHQRGPFWVRGTNGVGPGVRVAIAGSNQGSVDLIPGLARDAFYSCDLENNGANLSCAPRGLDLTRVPAIHDPLWRYPRFTDATFEPNRGDVGPGLGNNRTSDVVFVGLFPHPTDSNRYQIVLRLWGNSYHHINEQSGTVLGQRIVIREASVYGTEQTAEGVRGPATLIVAGDVLIESVQTDGGPLQIASISPNHRFELVIPRAGVAQIDDHRLIELIRDGLTPEVFQRARARLTALTPPAPPAALPVTP